MLNVKFIKANQDVLFESYLPAIIAEPYSNKLGKRSCKSVKIKVQFVDQNKMEQTQRILADIVAQAMLNRRHRENG